VSLAGTAFARRNLAAGAQKGVRVDEVIWGALGRGFGLRSSCTEVLALARVVFAPWQIVEQHRVCNWTIEPNRAQWEVRNGHDEEVRLSASRQEALVWIEYGSILLLEFPETHLALHGALLRPPGGGPAVVLAGSGQSGKSTLAAALWGAGWHLYSDDTTFVSNDGTEVLPAPRRCALRKESRDLLGPKLWERIANAPGAWALERGPVFHADAPAGPLPLGAVVILKGDPGPWTRLAPGSAVFALAVFCRQYGRVGLAPVLKPLCALANRAPVYHLHRENLPTMLRTLLENCRPAGEFLAPY
jgi:hypothetical protein